MADEKSRDMNQQQDHGKEKAQGSAAKAGAQGQQGQQGQVRPQDTESPGQGGGVQGTGQRQPSQGQSDQDAKNQEGRLRDQGGQGGQTDDDDF